MRDLYKVYDKVRRVLRSLIRQEKRNFFIYPFNIVGRIVKLILNSEFELKELACLSDINEMPLLLNRLKCKHEDIIILLAIDDNLTEIEKSDYRHELLLRYPVQQIIDVCSESMFFDSEMFYEESYFTNPRSIFMESCSREIYANDIKGEIAECGVYQGDSAVILNGLFPDRRLFLFDTFSGYDERDMTEQEYDDWGEYMIFCNNRFRNVPELESILHRMPWRDRIFPVKGRFPDTVIDNQEILNTSFALVNLDMNLYLPMKASLEFFWPRLSPGGIILVDDIRHKGLPSSRKAFLEFCSKNRISYASITYNGMGMAAISKSLNEYPNPPAMLGRID